MVHADAAYDFEKNKQKAVSNGAVISGGAAIHFVARTQKCTTLSSSEARIWCDGGRL